MAEIVGLGVGLASFGVQLIDSTKKLKALCEDIKNAPVELQDTIKEIEVMNDTISAMDSLGDESYPGAGALARSIDLCRRALDRLGALTDDLQNRLRSSNKIRARFSVVLKKDSMDRLVQRLEHCKSLMTAALLSYTMYMMAQNISQFALQRQKLEDLHNGQMTLISLCTPAVVRQASTVDEVQAGQVQSIEDAISTPQARRPSRPRQTIEPQRSVRQFGNRTSRWNFSRVLELTMAQIFPGWTASLQFYRIGVPQRDPFFQACGRNDLITVKELLQARKATPYDQDSSGDTALDWAMSFGAFDVSKYLHQHASLPAPSVVSVYNFIFRRLHRHSRIEEATDEDLWEGSWADSVHVWVVALEEVGVDFSDESFQDPLLNSFTVPVESMPTSKRLDLMMAIVSFPNADYAHWKFTYNILKDIIRGSPLNPALLDADKNDGRSLLHIFAGLLRNGFDSCRYDVADDKQAMLSHMESMVAECISRGADLTAQGKWNAGVGFYFELDGLTPLAMLVHRFIALYRRKKYFQMNQILRDWAQILAHSGVDLMVYGALETALNLQYINWRNDPERILGFAYGPEPRDWHFLFLAEHDHRIGEFWRMIEEPERQIPGAWIEEDSDKEDGWEAYSIEKRMEEITERKLRRKMKKTKHTPPTF